MLNEQYSVAGGGSAEAAVDSAESRSTSMRSYLLPLSVVLVLVAAYYILRWHSVENLVVALDQSSHVFLDFTYHYLPQAQAILHSPVPVNDYYYSAFFALLLLPLTLLDGHAVMLTWASLQVLVSAALFALPLRRLVNLGPTWTAAYAGVFITSFPVLHGMRWGQISALLTLLIVAAFDADARDRKHLAGALLAVAAAIKFYPALFGVYFVVKRDWRVCRSFILVFVLCYVVFPAVVLGPDNWIGFELATTGAIATADWVSASPNSQYFAHVLSRLAHSGELGLWKTLGFAVVGSAAALAWTTQRRALWSHTLVMLFASVPFLVYTSWPHYFAFLPFCQVALAADLLRRRPSLVVTLAWALLIASTAISSILVFGLFDSWADYTGMGMLLVADILVLICALLLRAAGPTPDVCQRVAEPSVVPA